ncbi:hypothetical protein [Aeropyrum camini]|nr:hypothetical protein [Aeropyrum camini]
MGAFPRGEFKRSTLRKASEAYSIMGGAPLNVGGRFEDCIRAGEA